MQTLTIPISKVVRTTKMICTKEPTYSTTGSRWMDEGKYVVKCYDIDDISTVLQYPLRELPDMISVFNEMGEVIGIEPIKKMLETVCLDEQNI